MSSSGDAASDNRSSGAWKEFGGHKATCRTSVLKVLSLQSMHASQVSLTFAEYTLSVTAANRSGFRIRQCLTMVYRQLDMSQVSIMTSARKIRPAAVIASFSGDRCSGNECLLYGHPHICATLNIEDDGDIK